MAKTAMSATTNPYLIAVHCAACGHTMPPDIALLRCEACGGDWLNADYDIEAVAALWPGALQGRESTMWRYAEMLPLGSDHRVTMGEGWTPLLHARRLGEALGHPGIYMKDERQSPTSSFKDRQAALSVSAMSALGVTECVLASTGNAAAAYAAYCARAGIKLWVFLTSRVPAPKMREAALYGAEVIKISGTYDNAKQVAADFAARRGLFLERGAKSVIGKESMKLIAYEIAEQMGWRAPDWYIQAVSGGIGPIGVWKGFEELHRLGLIDHLPKMAIIQAEGCAPMVEAFRAGKEKADPVTPRTAITVLATGDPGPAYTHLREAVRQTGGTMAAVSDEAAFQSLRHLAQMEGLSVEPAAAVAFAGMEKLLREGVIAPDEVVAVNASGHTLLVETFIIGDQFAVDVELQSALAEQWGLPEEGLDAALEYLDERITTVVVIDDNPTDCRLIRRLLQRHKSYRIFEAYTGHEGLDLIRARRPGLIVLDLGLPDIDGLEILEMLKQEPEMARIPVVVITGKSLGPQEQNRLEGQIVSAWQKGSFSTRDLAEHIILTLGDRAENRIRAHTEDGAADSDVPLVMVVDDNPLDSRLLRRSLEQTGGCRIVEVHDGRQAVGLIQEHSPALIILDLMMAGMSGFEVLEQIPTDIPVIVVSAKELTTEERTLLENRARSLWRKGNVDRALLQRDVRRTLGNKRGGNE